LAAYPVPEGEGDDRASRRWSKCRATISSFSQIAEHLQDIVQYEQFTIRSCGVAIDNAGLKLGYGTIEERVSGRRVGDLLAGAQHFLKPGHGCGCSFDVVIWRVLR
jgi:hypothetical protein